VTTSLREARHRWQDESGSMIGSASKANPRKLSPEPPLLSPHLGFEGTRQASLQSVADKDTGTNWFWLLIQIAALSFAILVAPLCCRLLGLASYERCVILIFSVLLLSLTEVMPLYCTALLIPVLGTFCAVLGEKRTLFGTSSLLVANIFNNVSFTVLGALVINGIFVKCRLERRLMGSLMARFSVASPVFLILLMLGGMTMCSVLYSGSLVLLTALKPFLADDVCPDQNAGVAKRLLLAVAFAANAGSTWLPISSPVNLITISLLREFDHEVPLHSWVFVAAPVGFFTMLGLWPLLLAMYPAGAADLQAPAHDAAKQDAVVASRTYDDDFLQLTRMHYFFMGIALLAILGMTFFTQAMQTIFGNPACLALCVVVAAFGSGFMSREEFLQLDWDLLALIGGTNVMAFLVRETGLGAELSAALVASPIFLWLPYWGLLSVMVLGTMLVSTMVGHSLTGVLLLPLVVATGVKLQAAETTALLCAIAVPFGMGMPHSSFDNLASYMTSRTLGRSHLELKQRDFRISGGPVTFLAAIVILVFGFGVCVANFGMPPPVVVSETGTPEKLKPKVVVENRPPEAKQVAYNDQMANWKAFLKRPGKKAFAVGELKKGLKTRPWAAAWNHVKQKDANKAALEECERMAGKCRLIWPIRSSEDEEEEEDVKANAKKTTPEADKQSPPKDDVVAATTPAPAPAPAPNWVCHEYDGAADQDDEWCSRSPIEGGLEYSYNGGTSDMCGGCWCCKRPVVKEESSFLALRNNVAAQALRKRVPQRWVPQKHMMPLHHDELRLLEPWSQSLSLKPWT